MRISVGAKFYADFAHLLLPGDQLLGSRADIEALPGAPPGLERIVIIASASEVSAIDPALCDGWAANIEGGTDRLGAALTFANAVHAIPGKKAIFAPLGADLELWMLINTQTGQPITNPTQTQRDDNYRFNALLPQLDGIAFQVQTFYGPNSVRKLTLEQTAARIMSADTYVRLHNPYIGLSAQFWMLTRQTPQQVYEIANAMRDWLELLGIAGENSTLSASTIQVIQGLEGRVKYVVLEEGVETRVYDTEGEAKAAIELATEQRYKIRVYPDPFDQSVDVAVT